MNMGIDPNNHRLSHSIRPLQNSPTPDNSASSGSKENAKNEAKRPLGDNYDQVSDAGSGLEDESCGLPDLNLDLTMNIPSASPIIPQDTQKPTHESKTARDPNFASSPTLLLFN